MANSDGSISLFGRFRRVTALAALGAILSPILSPAGVFAQSASSTRLSRPSSPHVLSVSETSTRISLPAASAAPVRLSTGGLFDAFRQSPVPPATSNPQPKQTIFSGASVSALFPVKRLQMLQGRDLVVLVDKSSSMRTIDAPGGLSRWDWTARELSTLSGQLGRIPDTRLDVIFFDNGTRKYTGVKLNALPSIYADNSPSGGTDVARAMREELENLVARQSQGGAVRPRPMLMAVITDGAPSSSRALKDLIIDTTRKLGSPAQLKITFLQVGSENQGNRLLPELDHGLVQEGAAFDIVKSRSFAELIRSGLVNALIDAVS